MRHRTNELSPFTPWLRSWPARRPPSARWAFAVSIPSPNERRKIFAAFVYSDNPKQSARGGERELTLLASRLHHGNDAALRVAIEKLTKDSSPCQGGALCRAHAGRWRLVADAPTTFAAAPAWLVARFPAEGRGGRGRRGRVLAARPARGVRSDVEPDAHREGRLLRIARFRRGALDHIQTAAR
jgi:hypothetical protein